MKVKLFHKIFCAILLTAIIGSAVFFGVMQRVILWETAVVHRAEENGLDRFATVLAKEFESRGDWDVVRGKTNILMGLSSQLMFSNDPVLPALPSLALLDADKRFIAGKLPGDLSGENSQREIVVGAKTVGWLVLQRRGDPPGIYDIKQETATFQIMGCGFLLLVALVAYILTRHLLRPIKEMARGIRAVNMGKLGIQVPAVAGDELAQLAYDFKSMTQRLTEYQSMRKQWTSDIAHELRTPLTILQGEIAAVQDGYREMTPQTLGSLQEELSRLSKLVDDLHELSMVDSGALHFKKEPVDPLAVLKVTLRSFQTMFSQEQIAVQEDLPAGQPPSVMIGDADRLAQLYSNLLDNALKYVDKPGILTIRHEYKNGSLLLRFDDSGPGVLEEALEHLFDRLYRADASRASAISGSGIGLAICKAIAEAHGGRITALSSPMGGVRIELVFPLASALDS